MAPSLGAVGAKALGRPKASICPSSIPNLLGAWGPASAPLGPQKPKCRTRMSSRAHRSHPGVLGTRSCSPWLAGAGYHGPSRPVPPAASPPLGGRFRPPDQSAHPQGGSAEANNLSWKPSQGRSGLPPCPAPQRPSAQPQTYHCPPAASARAPSNHLPRMIQQIFPPWGEKQGCKKKITMSDYKAPTVGQAPGGEIRVPLCPQSPSGR